MDNKADTITVGDRGQVLLQDVVLLDEMAHFDRERIPERVVHAKGAGEYNIVKSDLLIFIVGFNVYYHEFVIF